MLLLLKFRCCITSYCAILMYMHIYTWLTQNKCKLRGLFNTEGSNHWLKWEHTLRYMKFGTQCVPIGHPHVFECKHNHKDALTYTNNTPYQSKAAGTAWLIVTISNMLGGCFSSPVTWEPCYGWEICKLYEEREKERKTEREKGKKMQKSVMKENMTKERKKRWKKWLKELRKKERRNDRKIITKERN